MKKHVFFPLYLTLCIGLFLATYYREASGVTVTGNPDPDIKADSSNGPVNMDIADTLSVTVSLDSGDSLGENADWWVAAYTPLLEWYYYGCTTGVCSWSSGFSYTYQGGLSDLTSYEVLITPLSGLPTGTYTFYFGVDLIMNGSLGPDRLYSDSVVVGISNVASCDSNNAGNGSEIVSGPSGPSADGEDNDSVFRALTVGPSNPDTLVIGTERNGFVKSTDGGISWTRLRSGLRHDSWGYPEVYDVAISSSNTDIIYAATVNSPGPLSGNYPSVSSGVYKSTDGGQTWQRRNCGIENARVTIIHVSTNSPDKVITGVAGGYPSFFGTDVDSVYFDGGLLISNNGGNSWSKITIEANDKYNDFSIIRQAASDPDKLYTFGFNYDDQSLNIGFVKSTDGGTSWAQFAPSLKNILISYFDVSSDGSVIYAVERDLMKIVRSGDGGESWTEYTINSGLYALAVSPSDANRVLFATYDKLYLSTDGMESRTAVIENLSATTIEDIVFAPSNNEIVYALAKGYILYKSEDKGAIFTRVINIRSDVLNVVP